ncbi:hypothetical protein IFM89_030463 [Coptis chinensis]|uniref:Uncharacterized protein n=1 Tax=Coptis chinensis TaxID=261450 RepID=A0A835H9B3_9MAGN|nr:hypothetical protein IFM89_030463 [Coptis chinensis]
MRGSTSKDKARRVRRLIRKFRSLVVGLQETKREDCNSRFTGHIWGRKPHGWEAVPSIGRSGGMLVLWDTYRVVVEDSIKGAFSLSILCTMLESKFSWVFTAIYGPVDMADKEQLWDELIDVDGDKFTYSDHRVQPRMSRLDRFIVTPTWMEYFDDHVETALGYNLSDHRMVVLQNVNNGIGLRPFRFELMWMEKQELLGLMETWWNEDNKNGRAGYVLFKKLQHLKHQLKDWNKMHFGRFDVKIKEL